MPRRLSLLLALSALACPALAGAQEASPRVYIVSVAMSDDMDAVATRTGSAARAALRTIEGVEWQGPDQLFLGYDDSSLTVLSRARERLEAGRQAYLNLELEQAIEQLQGAVADFDAAAAALEDPGDLGQALLFLGASHAFNMQRREAIQVFRRLHTQMPHIQPDPDTFNPDVVQLYEAAAPPDARSPSGTISVDSNPQGAIVYVDFLARGRTPLNVEGLIAGEHVVRVSRPGATPFVETLAVRRGRASTSTAYLVDRENLDGLSDALVRIRDAGVERLTGDSAIAEVATMLDLSKIGVIRVSDAGGGRATLELLLFDTASGRRLVRGQGTVETGTGVLEAGVQRLVAGAFEAALRPSQAADAEAIPAVDTTPTTTTPAGPPGPPIYEEWWFWTIIGAVVVVGVGVGVGVAVASEGPPLGNDPGGQVIFTF